MPLMRPEIQNVLRSAGLVAEKRAAEEGTISEKLDAAGLSLTEVLDDLAAVARGTMNESLKVRCLETVLKAHGALKETAAAPPSFTIVIQNGGSATESNYALPEGVNPILLPRQLLAQHLQHKAKSSEESVQ